MATSKSKSKTTSQKKRKDPNAPKKPMSGYLLFGKEERSKNSELSRLPVAEQGKIISDMWKNLSEASREEYNQKSAKEREAYQVAVGEYKKSAEYQEYLEKTATEGSGKKKKGTKKATGYNEFFKVVYKSVSSENPDFSMGETTSAVAKKWKELSEDEKATYNRMAEEKNASIAGK